MKNYSGEECEQCGNCERNSQTHNCVICLPSSTGIRGRHFIKENMTAVQKKREILFKMDLRSMGVEI